MSLYTEFEHLLSTPIPERKRTEWNRDHGLNLPVGAHFIDVFIVLDGGKQHNTAVGTRNPKEETL